MVIVKFVILSLLRAARASLVVLLKLRAEVPNKWVGIGVGEHIAIMYQQTQPTITYVALYNPRVSIVNA